MFAGVAFSGVWLTADQGFRSDSAQQKRPTSHATPSTPFPVALIQLVAAQQTLVNIQAKGTAFAEHGDADYLQQQIDWFETTLDKHQQLLARMRNLVAKRPTSVTMKRRPTRPALKDS
ncbi:MULTISPECIES: hypothetical protein [Paraburkholderia]|uniref:Uncharacterized protein n=1 Tax=Paraburkholderia madseniana TaxID=2599607 RepID=A0AAP5ESR8_9BURK|nr:MULTISPECIES: hypothetical protein [Paraburkholderia]MCX4151733.1 hypothetical protein [Paraburkholderia madseniana]MDN7154660.1 hypothetical protein [Paraburkholderia sp. WS6]MDQ6413543.1 hypothetical protein [Paraburkholderia madseniana]